MALSPQDFDEIFRQPPPYPFPNGSTTMDHVRSLSDAELRRWSWPQLRDQAVSILEVLANTKGRLQGLHWAIDHGACTAAHHEELARTRRECLGLVALGHRVRAILEEAPQPRSHQARGN